MKERDRRMALTAYCKKCKQEVSPGEICPRCGTRLARTAVHAAWVVERRPAADWMCWNAVMRWLLPAAAFVLILVLVLEGLSGGTAAVERLFQNGFLRTLGLLLLGLTGAVLVLLLLQGADLMDYVVDSRGVHVTRYLPSPTPLKLIARMKSPRLMDQVDPAAGSPVLRLDERNITWREVARVQLWPEKCYILFYGPAWWLRIPVRCDPFHWEDALYFVRDKLGKKKAVDLPPHLRAQAAQAAKKKPAASPAPHLPAARPDPRPDEASDPWGEESPVGGSPDPWPDESSDRQAPDASDAPEDKTASVPPDAGEQLSLDLDPD